MKELENLCWPTCADLLRVAMKIFKGFGEKSFSIGWDPVSLSTKLGLEPASIVHYTWPGSSIKQPTPNYLTTQCHVNWPVVYPESSYKIMDPVSAALPQDLRRILVTTRFLEFISTHIRLAFVSTLLMLYCHF